MKFGRSFQVRTSHHPLRVDRKQSVCISSTTSNVVLRHSLTTIVELSSNMNLLLSVLILLQTSPNVIDSYLRERDQWFRLVSVKRWSAVARLRGAIPFTVLIGSLTPWSECVVILVVGTVKVLREGWVGFRVVGLRSAIPTSTLGW